MDFQTHYPVLFFAFFLFCSANGLALNTNSTVPDPSANIPKTDDDKDAEQFQVTCGPGDEYLRDPTNCGRFYQCAHGIAYLMNCPSGLYFDLENRVCDYPENVDCVNPSDRCTRRRAGADSGNSNGDESVARCPRGTFPVSCVASDASSSQGTYVDGRECRAVNNRRGDGQRAIAICASGDEEEYVFENSGNAEREPQVTCPVNYRIVNCFYRNSFSFLFIVFPSIDARSGTCSLNRRCLLGGCSVQAVCRRVNNPA